MKMLTEGKPKESMYNVCYQEIDNFYTIPIGASSAQEAVDIAREIKPEIDVVEVSKVVKNWK